MSKKIPSERSVSTDDNTPVIKCLNTMDNMFCRLSRRYPAHFLCCMLACMIVSGILAFSVMRSGSPRTLPTYPKLPPVGSTDGISETMETYGTLQDVLAIQDTITAIINKKNLDQTDSVRLTGALKRFEQLQHSIYKPEIRNKNNQPKPCYKCSLPNK
ncbi:hypothetical protein OHD16_15745 [Sphingobacterium sp. ML3W]|uniref:hypothetical protein n=1 Tax=Sphingobacterium sp. ML3W TaxID=1538644 RepID=UPI00249BEFBD|nr:hypothetical protein [Sphingobacterium sp. ML3W]WFA81408.1 hypothetical protein OGI71_08885 [Sphingobacterium sp. ML3W]